MKERLSISLEMVISIPKKTTTGVSLECLGVKVEREAGSVQRALEEALTEFGHQLRVPLLKKARVIRAEMAELMERLLKEEDKDVDQQPSPGAIPETFAVPPRLFNGGSTNLFGLVIPEDAGGPRITSIYGGDPEPPGPEELPKTDPA